MNSPHFKLTPLGGLKQIGSNMFLVEGPNNCILIDAGLLFPSDDSFDINYLVPDLSFISQIPTDLILTHGHEDHIGAISEILSFFPDIKIWASSFCKKLVQKKLYRKKISREINTYNAHSTLLFDDFNIHPIHVNHSIPETFGLLIKSKLSDICLFYVSDFKVDKLTQYEPYFDFKRLVDLSKNCQLKLLLADSTNITSKQKRTKSEFDLISDFDSIISNKNQRIFITLFASNIHRIQTILNLCEKYQRPLITHGMSIQNYITVALEEGLIHESNLIKLPESVEPQNKNNVILLSGCQGDMMGTLRRVASGEDALFKPHENDIFVFSSKPIPGNEKKVSSIMNLLSEIGAEIITPDDFQVHASGHAGESDLLDLYNTFLPTHAIPIHGESYFLKKHFHFIKKHFPHITAHLVYNFDEYVIYENLKIDHFKCEKQPKPLMIVGEDTIIGPTKISERRKLASLGLIVIVLTLDSVKNGRPLFEIQTMGVPDKALGHLVQFKELCIMLTIKLKKLEPEKLSEEIRVFSRRFFKNIIGQRPVTIVQII